MTPPLYEQPGPLLVPGKREPEEPQDHGLRRSRGGLTTKIHMLCDANSVAMKFLLSGGQASDITYAQPLLDQAYIPACAGAPANAADGCWRIKDMTQKRYVGTATGIGCNR